MRIISSESWDFKSEGTDFHLEKELVLRLWGGGGGMLTTSGDGCINYFDLGNHSTL